PRGRPPRPRRGPSPAGLRALDEGQEGAVEVVRPGVGAEVCWRTGGEDRAVAHEQRRVAAIGLFHHMARYEQGCPAVRQRAERAPEVAAEDRVEADGR